MKNITIKQKLYGLAALTIICLIALSAVTVNSFSTIKLLDETLILVQKSKSDMLTLRRNEKDFLARLDLKYQQKFTHNFDTLIDDIHLVQNNLNALKLNKADDLSLLIEYLNDYNRSFDNVIKINQDIGLTPKSGLRGQLRASVHDAEAKLKETAAIQLIADMLMLRRNEKDFMLRKLEKYIGKFQKNYAVFNQHLQESTLSYTDKKLISTKMNAHQSMFLDLTKGYLKLGLTPKTGLHGEMRNNVHQTEDIFNSLTNELSTVIDSQTTQLYSKLLILTAFFMFLIVASIVFISRSINARLGIIKDHLNQVVMSSGNLSASLNIEGEDEVTDIARLFNQFVASLKETFRQIPAFSDNLEQVSNENTEIAKQTYQLASSQQEKSDHVREAVQQMVNATEEITSNIHIAANAAEEANETVQKGKSAIEEVGSSISTLADKLHSSAEATKELEDDSQNISTVLDVIRGIAEQTNLLALNAAIEAARAGEHGRGFAVVADEVRTLASRTQDSTTQIQSFIESLQTNVKNTVSIMQDSSAGASLTATDALTATQELDKISNTVSRIFDLNTSIATASEEQSAISTSISNSVTDINETAQETAIQANEASQSSIQINTIAADLKKLISTYTL